MTDRKIVIPGEAIVSGDDYLPGEGTEKRGNSIVALRYGLAEESNKLVKIIPLSGPYIPRRGNVVIGKVELITHNGWVINIGCAENGFLSVMEVPRYVNKDAMDEVMSIGDMAVLKIWSMNGKGIDLSLKSRGLGKIYEGLIFKTNPNKVPRVIGKEGSMIKLIKDETGCNITVGQNGYIWIRGDKIDDELLAKKAINFIVENSFIEGLTEEVEKWFKKNGGKGNGQSSSKKARDVQEEVNAEVEAMENDADSEENMEDSD
jgi:exosome complex component RRP4